MSCRPLHAASHHACSPRPQVRYLNLEREALSGQVTDKAASGPVTGQKVPWGKELMKLNANESDLLNAIQDTLMITVKGIAGARAWWGGSGCAPTRVLLAGEIPPPCTVCRWRGTRKGAFEVRMSGALCFPVTPGLDSSAGMQNTG